jgi:hypothetical protein
MHTFYYSSNTVPYNDEVIINYNSDYSGKCIIKKYVKERYVKDGEDKISESEIEIPCEALVNFANEILHDVLQTKLDKLDLKEIINKSLLED